MYATERISKMSIFKSIKEIFKPSTSTLMDRAIAKATKDEQKYYENIKKKGLDLIVRDMGAEGKTWKFYLAKEDGTYTKAMTYDEVKPIYASGNLLSPEIANAIVTTDTGYITRRGMEDLYRRGVKLDEDNMQVLSPYRIPLDDPEAEKRATSIRHPAKQTPTVSVASNFSSKSTFAPPEHIVHYAKKDEDFDIEDGVLFRYTGTSEEVKIPEGVKIVGTKAFYKNNSVKGVYIPHTVETIEETAFSCCENLTSVTMAEGITSIGESAFSCCENLISVTMAEGITSIGKNAFYNCKKLKSVEIPSSIESIEEGAFSYCENLEHISLPNGPKSIGEGAFSCCKNLTSVTMAEGITSIGKNAFSHCSKLKHISLPKGLQSIGDGAFSYCERLYSIEIPRSITNIGKGAFSCCKYLSYVTMAEGITSIGEDAFSYCEGLYSIEIPRSIKNIGKRAFYGCVRLRFSFSEGITGLKTIPESAFGWCSNTHSVAIPICVKHIDRRAFAPREDIVKYRDHLPAREEREEKEKAEKEYILEKNFNPSGLEVIYYSGSKEMAKEIGLMNLIYCDRAVIRYNWKK